MYRRGFWLLASACLAVWNNKPAEYGPVFHSGGKSSSCKNNCASVICVFPPQRYNEGGRRFRLCWSVVFSQHVNARDLVGIQLTVFWSIAHGSFHCYSNLHSFGILKFGFWQKLLLNLHILESTGQSLSQHFVQTSAKISVCCKLP